MTKRNASVGIPNRYGGSILIWKEFTDNQKTAIMLFEKYIFS